MLANVAELGPVEFSTHLAVPSRWVGPRGAGSRLRSKPKWVAHAALDGGSVHVLNTHFLPSVTRTAKFLGKREWQARRRHFRDHVAYIVALCESLPGTVILCGDFNATVDFDLLGPLHEAGFGGWTREPTFGKRAIDHCLILDRGGWEQMSQTMLDGADGIASDHKTPLIHYTRKETP